MDFESILLDFKKKIENATGKKLIDAAINYGGNPQFFRFSDGEKIFYNLQDGTPGSWIVVFTDKENIKYKFVEDKNV